MTEDERNISAKQMSEFMLKSMNGPGGLAMSASLVSSMFFCMVDEQGLEKTLEDFKGMAFVPKQTRSDISSLDAWKQLTKMCKEFTDVLNEN